MGREKTCHTTKSNFTPRVVAAYFVILPTVVALTFPRVISQGYKSCIQGRAEVKKQKRENEPKSKRTNSAPTLYEKPLDSVMISFNYF